MDTRRYDYTYNSKTCQSRLSHYYDDAQNKCFMYGTNPCYMDIIHSLVYATSTRKDRRQYLVQQLVFNGNSVCAHSYGSGLHYCCCMLNFIYLYYLMYVSSCLHQNIHYVSVSILTGNKEWSETILQYSERELMRHC